jgi:ribonuclease HI
VAFVDGSVDVNKSAALSNGGAGAIIVRVEEKDVKSIHLRGKHFHGYDDVTNNTMELQAVGVAARSMEEGEELRLWSDSKYALGCLFDQSWKPGANKDLILKLKKQIRDRRLLVEGTHVRGHKSLFLNELADFMASVAVKKQRTVFYNFEYRTISADCLGCRRFPCGPAQDLKTIKEKLRAIKEDSWEPCDKLDLYADLTRRPRVIKGA